MKTLSLWGLRISVLLYALLHLITSFFNVEFLQQTLSFIGLTILFFSFIYFSFSKFKLPFFILSAGLIILFVSGTPLILGVKEGVLQMRGLIGLLIIIPLISWVLREESYIEDIMTFFYPYINTSRKFYFGLTAFTQVIAFFLLFGSIPMMHQFINTILKSKTSEAWENFKATAILRGFGLTTMWVISIPSFIVAIDTLGASIWTAIIQGFLIALIGTLMATLFAHYQEKSYGVNLTAELQTEIGDIMKLSANESLIKRRVFEFGLLFLTLFGTIFILHGLLKINLMLLIPLVVIFWTMCFYIIKGRAARLKPVMKGYFLKDLPNQAHQASMMLAIGILIYSLKQTNFSENVVLGLNYIQEIFPFINTLYLLPLVVVLLGLIGLGPLTVMVLVAGILAGLSLPYPPELIVLAVTSGSVISTMLSPLVIPVVILNSGNGLGLIKNGIGFNWKYAVSFYVVVQLYIQLRLQFL